MAVNEAEERKTTGGRLVVLVSYNGVDVELNYSPSQVARALREQALNHFGIKGPEREEHFLFSTDNQTEIDDAAKLGDQIEPRKRLYLRRRAAGGGA